MLVSAWSVLAHHAAWKTKSFDGIKLKPFFPGLYSSLAVASDQITISGWDTKSSVADSYHKYETAYLGVLSTQCHEKSDKFNCSKLIKELWENYLDSL